MRYLTKVRACQMLNVNKNWNSTYTTNKSVVCMHTRQKKLGVCKYGSPYTCLCFKAALCDNANVTIYLFVLLFTGRNVLIVHRTLNIWWMWCLSRHVVNLPYFITISSKSVTMTIALNLFLFGKSPQRPRFICCFYIHWLTTCTSI